MIEKHIRTFFTLFFANFLFVSIYAQGLGLPPELDATLNDTIYCAGTEKSIVENFTLTDPDNSAIDGVFIQISSGYIQGEDRLIYRGSNPNISDTWEATEGKLKLTLPSPTTNYQVFIDAVNSVVYSSSNTNPTGSREFSITLDEANFLPSTGHYYEYIEDVGISWQEAKDAAELLDYYGLQGYLATITSPEEAQLAGEQANGAGWIGGSDAQTEGTWRWVTGPEGLETGGLGRQFWQGLGSSNGGSTTAPDNYANWNGNSEPNNLGNENYTHIVHPDLPNTLRGTWNDLAISGDPDPNSFYHPQGYIVEYGGMPGDPVLNNSASTKIIVGEITSTTTSNPICGSGSATISAISNTGIVNWYTDTTSSTPIQTGNNLTTPILSVSTIYYAAPSDCNSVRIPVQITVFPLPTVTSIVENEICESGSTTLSATPSEGIVNWYDSPTSTSTLSSGNSYTTPIITSTTTYYVEVVANGCSSAFRTPVTATVTKIPAPVAPLSQDFCESENALVSDLIVTGSTINWYNASSGGTPIDPSTPLSSGFYYASEVINTCEGSARTVVEVTIFESVVPLPAASIPVLQLCDDIEDGDDTNGQTIFDLTVNETILLNGKNASDFSFLYFEDSSRTIQIITPNSYYNTSVNNQVVYVQIANILNNTCVTNTEISLEVIALPVIQNSVTLKNCDEDGTPDGLTDFNLTEADEVITLGDSNLSVTYYLSQIDAETASNPLTPFPFNNSVSSMVFSRVENSFGCYRIGTLNLDVSTTQFPPGYVYNLNTCENDDSNDGIASFNLTLASAELLNQLPPGQNLSVHYYRNITDAQLELNEITPQDTYLNETPWNETLIIRVENDDNGDCYDIGPFVTLTVNERPEFQVLQEGTVCINTPPLEMEVLGANGSYNYEWKDPLGTVISNSEFAEAYIGGTYTVQAFSADGCESFIQNITVLESEIAQISIDDISIVDDSDNNSISIDNSNLGSGDYEYTLDDPNGFYQDEPYFDGIAAGIHTVYVRDKNGCGVAGVEVSVIGFPKFFTPNNDGYNDTWQVKGVSGDFYPSSLIYIFDRFGKLLVQIDPRNEGWDGFYNGIMLPASDYWYSVQLIDKNNNTKERKGHFSLIRR